MLLCWSLCTLHQSHNLADEQQGLLVLALQQHTLHIVCRAEQKPQGQRERCSEGAQSSEELQQRGTRECVHRCDALLDQQLLQEIAIRREDHGGEVLRGCVYLCDLTRALRNNSGLGPHDLWHWRASLDGLRAAAFHDVREAAKAIGEIINALSSDALAALVEVSAQRIADAKAIVRQEPPCNIGEALLDDREAAIRSQADTFQRSKCPQDQCHVARQAEAAILLRDGLQLFPELFELAWLLLEFLSLLLELFLLLPQVSTPLVQNGQGAGEARDNDLTRLLVVSNALGEEAQIHEILEALIVHLCLNVHDVLDEGNTPRRRDLRHQPVVKDAQLPIRREHKVPRMRVTVQEACLKELHHVTVEEHLDNLLCLVLGRTLLRQLLPWQPFLDEHLAACEEHLGHNDRVRHKVATSDGLRKSALVCSLTLVVKLLDERWCSPVNEFEQAPELVCVALHW
mmetsp:Transcript_7878/g.18564  ORF Transcript_7878/g.18564 Transcript_7878/m.18564 type:complete len:457 (-) Transcript_7878:1339-2709(-)